MFEKVFSAVKKYCQENKDTVKIFAAGFLFLSVIVVGMYFSSSGSFFNGVFSGKYENLGNFFSGDAKNSNLASLSESVSGNFSADHCPFDSGQKPNRSQVILNEIAWMGNKESANNEWIELKNINSETVDITGWQILNLGEKIKIFIDKGEIAPDQFYLLLRGGSDFLQGVKADKFFSGAIKNSNEIIRLFDRDCNLMDEVIVKSSWPGGDNKTKATMERDGRNLKWGTSSIVGGTPKKENTFFSSVSVNPDFSNDDHEIEATSVFDDSDDYGPEVAGVFDNSEDGSEIKEDNFKKEPELKTEQKETKKEEPPALCPKDSSKKFSQEIIINEVAWAGASGKTTQEWIELKNNSGSSTSLAGWQLQNEAQTIKVFFEAKDSVSGNGFYLLLRGSSDFLQGIKADKFFSGTIKNSNEALILFDKNCNIIDEVLAIPSWQAGSASPDYKTAERSENLSWHTYSGSGSSGVMGTPRSENSYPVSSEPVSDQPTSPESSLQESPSQTSPPESPPSETQESSPSQSQGCTDGQIDINTAPKEDLIKIRHIGDARADELISLRLFASIDDMIKINGIGESRLADIKAEAIACVN